MALLEYIKPVVQVSTRAVGQVAVFTPAPFTITPPGCALTPGPWCGQRPAATIASQFPQLSWIGSMRRICSYGWAVLTAIGLLAACTRTPQRVAARNDGDAISALLAAGGNLEVDADTRRNLERLRAATSAFHDITAAQSAGYPTNIPQCLDHPSEGAMGQHYMKRILLDARLDVEQPEILLYAPLPDGKQKLLGVEYIVPFAKWESEQPPRIFGQALKRSENLKLWYLHVWAWEPNSRGLFADWNPDVKC